MKRIFIAVSFLFILSGLCIAQQSTNKDFFPLAVGTIWKYYFITDGYSSMVHSSSSEEGYVEYKVTSQTPFSGGKIWNIFQRRNYTRKSFYGYSWSTQYLKDSTNFNLVETDSSFHELYATTFTDNGGFPFQHVTADTSKFYRYMPVNAADNITRVINYPDIGNPPFYAHYVYSLKKDTGIVKLNYSHSSMMSGSTAQYTLDTYIKVYDEPFLNILKKNISISTLFGSPKDTTVVIRNDGAIGLNIYSIVSNNSKFTIQDYSRSISPSSTGFIKIRFSTNQEETVSGIISISSNSVGGDDSFTIQGAGVSKIIIQTDPQSYMNFGTVNNNQTKSLLLHIYNKGNLALRIDSIKTNNNAFSLQYVKADVSAGGTLDNTVYFSPKTTAEYSARINIYSNASSTPYVIELHAYSSEEIKYQINFNEIYFGIIKPGGHKDTTIVVSNIGKEPVYVNFFWKSRLSNGNQSWAFNFANTDIAHDKTLNPGETLIDVLRFSPHDNSMVDDELTIRFMSPYSTDSKYESIRLTGNISFSLGHNYPNPFNSSTKIDFTIGTDTHVKLKVYDLLGREIATIIDEELKSGNYEKTFNAFGLTSGIYFYHLSTSEFHQAKKFLLLK